MLTAASRTGCRHAWKNGITFCVPIASNVQPQTGCARRHVHRANTSAFGLHPAVAKLSHAIRSSFGPKYVQPNGGSPPSVEKQKPTTFDTVSHGVCWILPSVTGHVPPQTGPDGSGFGAAARHTLLNNTAPSVRGIVVEQRHCGCENAHVHRVPDSCCREHVSAPIVGH